MYAKGLNKHLSKEDTHTTSKHIKDAPHPSPLGRCQPSTRRCGCRWLGHAQDGTGNGCHFPGPGKV